MHVRTHILAWALLLIAVLAWVGVGFFAWKVSDMGATRSANIALQKSSSVAVSNATWVYTIATETQAQRTQLEGFISADPIAVVKSLTTTAKSIGVNVNITSAGLEGGAGVSANAPHAFGFMTDSQGSFTSLMRAVDLFETLPAPSSIQQLEFIRAVPLDSASVGTTTRSGADVWHLNAHIRILTNATISS